MGCYKYIYQEDGGGGVIPFSWMAAPIRPTSRFSSDLRSTSRALPPDTWGVPKSSPPLPLKASALLQLPCYLIIPKGSSRRKAISRVGSALGGAPGGSSCPGELLPPQRRYPSPIPKEITGLCDSTLNYRYAHVDIRAPCEQLSTYVHTYMNSHKP